MYGKIGIDNATISYGWENLPTGVKYPEKKGYNYMTGTWHSGLTNPMAYFVAQPSSGPSSLWVWFTDMSIGAEKVNWSFGDDDKDNQRSTYHKYARQGTYTAIQEIKVPEVELIPIQLFYSKDINVGP